MEPVTPRPGGKLPGSPDFLATLAAIGVFVSGVVVLMSESAPQGLRTAALVVVAPVTVLLLLAIYGGVLALPLWAMWKGARGADARRLPPAGTLTVAPDDGPLAPASLPKARPAAHHWGSREWVMTGLGFVGEAGGLVCFVLGMTETAMAFGALFVVGAGWWVLQLNQNERRRT